MWMYLLISYAFFDICVTNVTVIEVRLQEKLYNTTSGKSKEIE